jgi:ABC-type sugar transport system substrate-binding protein
MPRALVGLMATRIPEDVDYRPGGRLWSRSVPPNDSNLQAAGIGNNGGPPASRSAALDSHGGDSTPPASAGGEPRGSSPPRAGARTIAIFFRAMDNRYQELQRADCHAAARRYGLFVREVIANNDADKQLSQIQDCLREPDSIRPQALLVNPVRESMLRLAAHEAGRLGLGWVSLNRTCDYLAELRRQYPTLPFFSVDPDQRQIGRIQGQQFRVLLPRGGELLYIQGPAATSSARLRLQGVQNELAGAPIDVIAESGDWSLEGGARAVRRWLHGLNRRKASECVVGAQNDSMAVGARGALMEEAVTRIRPELRDVRVTGCDGSVAYGQQWVLDKQLTATVIIPPTAGRAVHEVMKALADRRPPIADISINVTSFPELDVLMRTSRRPR